MANGGKAFSEITGAAEVYSGGNRSKDLPSSCQMLPGHLDDVVTGLCFQKLSLGGPHGVLDRDWRARHRETGGM